MKINIDKDQLIRDMEIANTEASLVLKPYNEETWEEYAKCAFAFFPGCRLGALEPEFVLRVYDKLLAKNPDTAVILRCCGFGADLADEPALRDEVLDTIKSEWESLGKPQIITACDTCKRMFIEYLPEITVTSAADFLNDPVIGGLAKHISEEYDISQEEKTANRLELKETLKEFF